MPGVTDGALFANSLWLIHRTVTKPARGTRLVNAWRGGARPAPTWCNDAPTSICHGNGQIAMDRIARC